MARDISEQHFRRAAKREGFRIGILGLEVYGEDGKTTISYGYVFQALPVKLLRAASLRRAIACRKRDEAKKAAKP